MRKGIRPTANPPVSNLVSTHAAQRGKRRQSVARRGTNPKKIPKRQVPLQAVLMTLRVSPRQNLAQILPSGGGGDRTRVPRYFRESFYVCSRLFDFARAGANRRATTRTSREQGLIASVPDGDLRRDGIGDRQSGLSDKSPQPGSPFLRRPLRD